MNAPPRATYAVGMTPRAVSVGGAVLLFAVAIGLAIAIPAGPLACPVDTVVLRAEGVIYCERFVQPEAAPSHAEFVEARRDPETAERWLIVGVGALGTALLVTLGLRASAASRAG
jgi:hypothetical protein